MADNRTMAQMLQAPIEGYEDTIVVPHINANNFELKQTLINLVQSNQFMGRQDPHNHLRFFNKVTSTFRHPEVPNTTIKLLLFHFSLEGEARIWLDKEPPRSILTWEDLVSKFINQFFPPSNTTYLRNEITNFLQKPNEMFNEAWKRFKDLLRQCPHHGFSELHQLDTFYNALNTNDQDALDSAAGGNFLDKIPHECLSIIESKSKNENYLSNLCENNSHDGYDCQQQFSFVYEQESSYNQNYDGSDQIQNPQYPDIHPLSQENPLTNDEFEAYTNANNANMNDLQFKLDNFQKNQQDFQKKFEQMQDDFQNQMWNFMQNLHGGPPIPLPGVEKEAEATKDTKLSSTKDIQPLSVQEPPQDSDIRQLIEECSIKVYEEQQVKNVMEQPVELAPILSTKEPEQLFSMGYENLNTTPETESNEVIKSGVKNLLPIPSECEVTFGDKRECDSPISENSPVCDNSDIFFDSKINDDISVYDDDFEDIEYIEASLFDHEIVNVEEENDVYQQEEEEVDLEDISQIQDVVLREKLLSIIRLISIIESLNDNPTLDRMLNSFESDNSLSDNFSPEFETFFDHTEETRSEEVGLFFSDNSIPSGIENVVDDPEGDIYFLEELLIDDSIISHESSDSNFEDNPSIPRPPPEPPDAETDAGEEIPVVMNDKDEDVDYSSFIFVMFDKVFYLLSAESEDTIFDPGISD
nr:reverse transcriptase domain-containing protein [Tanacetum cinerariifolium]